MYRMHLLFFLAIAVATPLRRTCSGLQYPQQRNSPSQSIPYPVSLVPDASPLEIGFTIPDDAVGPCSLMLSLPPSEVRGSGTQVNVVALDGPAAGSVVGTTDFAGGAQATINSFACRAQMCYSLQVIGGEGSVGFEEGSGVGVTMTYDC